MQTTVALTADAYQNETVAAANVTVPNIPPGTYWLNASYSGDSNWNAVGYAAAGPLTYVTTTAVSTTTTLTVSPAKVDSSGSVTFNASVQANSTSFGAPFGEVLLYGNGTLFGGFVVLNGSGFTSSGSDTIPASEIPYGTLQVVAEYV
jgi:hypothetical protein